MRDETKFAPPRRHRGLVLGAALALGAVSALLYAAGHFGSEGANDSSDARHRQRAGADDQAPCVGASSSPCSPDDAARFAVPPRSRKALMAYAAKVSSNDDRLRLGLVPGSDAGIARGSRGQGAAPPPSEGAREPEGE